MSFFIIFFSGNLKNRKVKWKQLLSGARKQEAAALSLFILKLLGANGGTE